MRGGGIGRRVSETEPGAYSAIAINAVDTAFIQACVVRIHARANIIKWARLVCARARGFRSAITGDAVGARRKNRPHDWRLYPLGDPYQEPP